MIPSPMPTRWNKCGSAWESRASPQSPIKKLNARSSVTQDGLRLLSAPEAGGQHALVKYSSFVGLLVSRWAIAKVGLPRPEFFIHYDDTEYCIRLREAGNILLAADSCVVHKEVARGEARKEILGYVFYQEDIYRFCFRYFKHRNFACILVAIAAIRLSAIVVLSRDSCALPRRYWPSTAITAGSESRFSRRQTGTASGGG